MRWRPPSSRCSTSRRFSGSADRDVQFDESWAQTYILGQENIHSLFSYVRPYHSPRGAAFSLIHFNTQWLEVSHLSMVAADPILVTEDF